MVKIKKLKTDIKVNANNEPLCDYENCNNKAYKEIFQENSWCYLCRKHFESEQKRLKGKLTYSSLASISRLHGDGL